MRFIPHRSECNCICHRYDTCFDADAICDRVPFTIKERGAPSYLRWGKECCYSGEYLDQEFLQAHYYPNAWALYTKTGIDLHART